MVRKVKGQLAIWVILAVVLVASIILFFTISTLNNEEVEQPYSFPIDARQYVDECLRAISAEALGDMLPQGGFVNPTNTIQFDYRPVEYICENIGYYDTCVQQHPMLVEEFELELRDYLIPRLEMCFNKMKTEVESSGGAINFAGDAYVDVELKPDLISIEINRETEIRARDGQSRSFSEYLTEINHPAYNLVVIALEIASEEAQNCYFENLGYSVYYPRYKIEKYAMSEPTRVYTIIDEKTGIFMRTAVRSCAFPPGLP